MPTPQEIIDQYNDQPDLLIEKLDELPEVREIWHQNKDIMVNVNLYHGTRRKETPEEIKKNGFCSFARGEVEEFIDEAVSQCKVEIKAGPRVCYWMDETAKQLKSSFSGRDWEFTKEGAQPNLYATYNAKKGCNWAFRNPEIVHDAFYYRTPTVVMGFAPLVSISHYFWSICHFCSKSRYESFGGNRFFNFISPEYRFQT